MAKQKGVAMIKRVILTICLLWPVLAVFGAIVYFLFDINGAFDFNIYTVAGWLIIAFVIYKIRLFSRPESIDTAFSAPPAKDSASSEFDEDHARQVRNFGLYGSGYPFNSDINAPED